MTFAAPAALGSAEPQHQVVRQETPLEFENPCTGEPFTGTVTFLFVEAAVSSPGGVIHIAQIGFAQMRRESAGGADYVGTLVFVGNNIDPNLDPPPPNQVIVNLNPTFSTSYARDPTRPETTSSLTWS
jgi:hypothetical protein